jgi:curved DNA-binding protein CbpA
MKNYYTIFGVSKNATSKEINEIYNNYKSTNQLTVELDKIYNILSDYHSRRNYDSYIEKTNKLLFIKIPFFGYDFDEKYIKSFSKYEKKRYHIDGNRYLIYEKSIIEGNINKKYYIENNGKIELLSEDNIKKIKEEFLTKNTSSSPLLKETTHNKVLPK